jgi:signal transduction histidine kinase
MADNCTIVDEGERETGAGAEEIAELRASRARILLDSDAERRRIERELHDGLQQRLIGLATDLELASASVGADPEETMRHLAEVRHGLREAIEEMRTLAQRIHPALDAGGLGPALRLAAATADVPTRIDVSLGASVPSEIAGAVYFCCLDVLGRVGGAATTIAVRQRDDGVAFEIVADAEIDEAGGALRDRVEALGGSVEIRADPGSRTVWSGFLPLAR